MSRAPVRHRRIDRKRGDNVIDIEYSRDIYIVCRPKAKWKERKGLVMLNPGAAEHNSDPVFFIFNLFGPSWAYLPRVCTHAPLPRCAHLVGEWGVGGGAAMLYQQHSHGPARPVRADSGGLLRIGCCGPLIWRLHIPPPFCLYPIL